jgi:hypothetical protein
MDNSFLFLWGFIATILAVGPLAVAALLDYREKSRKSK